MARSRYDENLVTHARVYVAGPMSSLPEFNYPEFKRRTDWLRSHDMDVICPTEVGETLDGGRGGVIQQREYLRACIYALLQCNTIHLLPGWENSTGARCEAAIALSLGFTFVDEYGAEIDPPEECIVKFKDRRFDPALDIEYNETDFND